MCRRPVTSWITKRQLLEQQKPTEQQSEALPQDPSLINSVITSVDVNQYLDTSTLHDRVVLDVIIPLLRLCCVSNELSILEIVLNLQIMAKWRYLCNRHRFHPQIAMADKTFPIFLKLIEKCYTEVFLTRLNDITKMFVNAVLEKSNLLDLIINCINDVNLEASKLDTIFSPFDQYRQSGNKTETIHSMYLKIYDVLLKFYIPLYYTIARYMYHKFEGLQVQIIEIEYSRFP